MFSSLRNNPTLLGIFALFIWSTASTTASFLGSLPPFEVLMFVFFAMFSVTVVKVTINNEWSSLKLPWKVWATVVFGIGIQQILYILAFSFAPPAEADLIIFLWPLMAIGLSSLLLGDSFKFRYGVASLFGVLAICILSFDKVTLANITIGHVCALFCAFFWSLYTVMTRKMPKVGVNVIGMSTVVGFLATFIFHISLETYAAPSFSQIAIIVYYGLCVSFGAYILWTRALQRGKASYLTLSAYMKPVLSLFFLCSFGYATLSSEFVVAVLLVIAGGLVAHPAVASQIEKLLFSFLQDYRFAAYFMKRNYVTVNPR